MVAAIKQHNTGLFISIIFIIKHAEIAISKIAKNPLNAGKL